MKPGDTLRVATYNVHRCRGIDGRVRPDRIAEVLKEIGADIVALQEVVSLRGRRARGRPGRATWRARLGADYLLGENRKLLGRRLRQRGAVPLPTAVGQEPRHLRARAARRRGVLHIDVDLAAQDVPARLQRAPGHRVPGAPAPGTPARDAGRDPAQPGAERPPAGARATSTSGRRASPRGCCARTSRAWTSASTCAAPRPIPACLPLLHLDHIYYDDALELPGSRCTARARPSWRPTTCRWSRTSSTWGRPAADQGPEGRRAAAVSRGGPRNAASASPWR